MRGNTRLPKPDLEELVGEEWAEWYRMTPQARFPESMKLWNTFLALGGSLEPEPDPQGPFFDAEEWRENSLDGRPSVFYGAAEVRTFLNYPSPETSVMATWKGRSSQEWPPYHGIATRYGNCKNVLAPIWKPGL